MLAGECMPRAQTAAVLSNGRCAARAHTHTPIIPPPYPTHNLDQHAGHTKDLARGTDCTAWGPPSSDVLEHPYTVGGGGVPPPLDPPPPLPMFEADSQNFASANRI